MEQQAGPIDKSVFQPGVPALNLPNGDENVLKARLWETIRRLRKDPEEVYTELNFLRRPSAIPSDLHYDLQWHYSLINLPQAWDVTTGSGSVVAVIDSGALFNHPDLGPRLIPGFDFISDPENAGDGGPLDADATDVGDDPKRQSSSFHGTPAESIPIRSPSPPDKRRRTSIS